MPDVLGMIDEVADAPPSSTRPRTRRGGRRRRGPSRDEVLAETRDAIADSIPEAGLTPTPSRDEVMAATRGAIADTMPETTERGWALMSPDDAFGSMRPHAEPDEDDRGGPPDMDADDVAPGPDDEAVGPAPSRQDRDNDPAFRRAIWDGVPGRGMLQRVVGTDNPAILHKLRLQDAASTVMAGHPGYSQDDWNNAYDSYAAEHPVPSGASQETYRPGVVGSDDHATEVSPDDEAPGWEMMSSEEALGPGSRYTADELDDMRRAERHDRIGRGIMGGLTGLGSLIGLIGAARGNYSAQGAGQGLISGSEGHEFNAYDQARTSADQRIASDDEAARSERRDAMDAERLRVWEETQREAQQSHRGFQQLQEQQLQGRIQREQASHDPQSQESISARETFLATLRGAPSEVQDRFGTINLDRMDAASIDEAQGALQVAIDDWRAAQGRPRHGGGGSPRMPAVAPGGAPRPRVPGVETPPGTPTDEPQVSVLERRLRSYAQATGQDPDQVVQYYDSLPGRDQRAYRNLMDRRLGQAPQEEGESAGLPEGVDARTYERFAEKYRAPFGRSRSLAALTIALSNASDTQIAAALRSDTAAAALGASDLRARIYRQLNTYFHDFGGANVTPNEMARYFAGFGAGSITTPPAAFRSAVRQLLQASRAEETDVARSFAPQYVEYWRSRGGR